MATLHKIINGTACNSADWPNSERSEQSKVDPILNKLVQAILHHPMKGCISVPWVFSYYYQNCRQHREVFIARELACMQLLDVLDKIT